MRIRSTKPEFWRSRTVASVDWDARLVLKGLESYVDDNGVGKDDVALIVGDVFPRDMLANPRETVARVSEAIGALHQAGLVWRYEADGTPLLYISNWESIQRIDKPGKGRFPRPDGTMAFRESVIRESVASPRETVAPGTGEQGNRGTGEALAPLAPRAPASDAEFADGTPIPPEPDDDRAELVLVTDDAPVVEIASRAPKVHVGSSVQTLVRQHVPAGIPKDVQRKVAEQAQRLANDPNVDRRDLEAALVEWARRSDAGPGLLPHLVADAARARQGGKAGAARPEHKTRTLARLIAEADSNDQKGIS